jgi:hypothetical protein
MVWYELSARNEDLRGVSAHTGDISVEVGVGLGPQTVGAISPSALSSRGDEQWLRAALSCAE